MSFATVAEYEAKYGAVEDEGVLQVWLDDATTMLTAHLGSSYDPKDEAQAAALRVVCRDMVHRAFASAAPGIGVQSVSASANGFSESYTYANSTGDLYLTKAERLMLGLGNQDVRWMEPYLQEELGDEGDES